jgi:hypothetical protein
MQIAAGYTSAGFYIPQELNHCPFIVRVDRKLVIAGVDRILRGLSCIVTEGWQFH